MTFAGGDESDATLLSFKAEEQQFVQTLIRVVRAIAKRPEISSEQVSQSSLLLHALERLPLPSHGLNMALALSNRGDEGSFGYQNLAVDSDSIRLETGEVISGPQETDHESHCLIEIGVGWRHGDADFVELEDWVDSFYSKATKSDCEISFEGDSSQEVNWQDPGDVDLLWEQLPSDYS